MDPQKISRMIFIEKLEWERLYLIKDGITKIKEDSTSHTSHSDGLNIAPNQSHEINTQQHCRKNKHSMKIMCLYRCIDNIGNDIWSDEIGGRIYEHTHEGNNDRFFLTSNQRGKHMKCHTYCTFFIFLRCRELIAHTYWYFVEK
mgnify:CR=1 FL=1